MPPEPGLSAEVELTVGDDDTATAMGSGDVETLATPRIVALCEEATMRALEGRLAPNETSVGMRVQVDHLAPTRIGGSVRASATVEKVEGRRITFAVSVNDARGLIAAGKVTRVIIDRDRFLDKAV